MVYTDELSKKPIGYKGSRVYRSIFVHKWAEGRVSQESLVGRQLKKAFLLPRKELTVKRWKFSFEETRTAYEYGKIK